MSGGSLHYLYSQVDSSGGLRLSDLEEAEEILRRTGHAAAADLTAEVITALRRAGDIAWDMRGVWKAVEWYDSGDWGPEQIAVEAAKMEKP